MFAFSARGQSKQASGGNTQIPDFVSGPFIFEFYRLLGSEECLVFDGECLDLAFDVRN